MKLPLLIVLFITAQKPAVAQQDSVAALLQVNGINIQHTDTVACARKIYHWVTSHISYDWDCFYNPHCVQNNTADILNKQKAICSGYALLFQELCTAAGIRAGMVTGEARTPDRNDPGRHSFKSHAWNYFMANDQLHLVDCTWGSMVEDTGFYFDANPLLLAATHFTPDTMYAGLPVALPPAAYKALPDVYYKFFSFFTGDYRQLLQIKLTDSLLQLPFILQPKKTIAIIVNDEFTTIPANKAFPQGEHFRCTYNKASGITIRFRNPGTFRVTILGITRTGKNNTIAGKGIFNTMVIVK